MDLGARGLGQSSSQAIPVFTAKENMCKNTGWPHAGNWTVQPWYLAKTFVFSWLSD